MRKVKFRTWNSFDKKWNKEFVHEGVFHQWASAYDEFESGAGNYTVALIELENGQIESVLPMNVKFLN